MEQNKFPQSVNMFVKIQGVIEIISLALASIFYFLLAIGFFSGENLRERLNASIFVNSIFYFGGFFILGFLFILIRIFLKIKYKLRFLSIENVILLVKLPVFFVTGVAVWAYVLWAAI